MNCLQIMAIRVEQRESTAIEVQKTLTEYGCAISVRLGLHNNVLDKCSPKGLLILQLCSELKVSKELEHKLNLIDGVKAKLVDLSE
ncbi:MAG: hypothetical protein GXZ13_04515 [Synergistaceae bacterium]|nr:hypothetical protein [Synergistaceae bacterium]